MMQNRGLLYVAFVAVCLLFGTSYAVVSRALFFSDESMLSCLRMCFAAAIALCVLRARMRLSPGYAAHVRGALASGHASLPRMVFCGVINYGLPHSLITLAQRTVTSVAVTIAQPLVAVVALFAARLAFPEERITARRLAPQALALAGTVLTSIPSFGRNAHYSRAAQALDYCLLGAAVLSFGVGSVFLKWAFPTADAALLCAAQLGGSAAYGVAFCAWRLGPAFMAVAFRNIAPHTVAWSLLLGLCYTYATAMLWVFVVRELGPVKANFANFGQIVVGVVAGVLFLGEWQEFTPRDVAMSLAGLGFLTVSILAGFLLQEKGEKRRNVEEAKPE
jgi:drug/metabolite transporter (DMT)-like permease